MKIHGAKLYFTRINRVKVKKTYFEDALKAALTTAVGHRPLAGVHFKISLLNPEPINSFAAVCIRSLEIGAGDPKLPFKNHNHDAHTFSKFQRGTASVLGKLQYPKVRIPYLHLRHQRRTHILSAGRNYQLNYNDDSHTEPLWLNLIREAIWTTRSLFLFLVEQPSQLKYIEWPSFQSTLKTATLTLVLVALLIVALSSVDSALSYLLGLILRRKA